MTRARGLYAGLSGGLAALVLSALCACAGGEPVGPPLPLAALADTERPLQGGSVVGGMTSLGAHEWRGLAYAEPPVGALRWRAPRPVQALSGRREALAYGERCAQITNAFDQPEGVEPGLLVGSEDCLYLNVYAPPMSAEQAAGAGLPVMMWIHGGGNVWGRADTYDPSNLVVQQNVVVVTVHYRLGPLGWFAHPALRGGAGEPGWAQGDDSANFGTLDLIAALDWIGANIEAFGGDPANITVFGESAGGHNVASLLASPKAAGKFHRAIIQSGSFDSVPLAEATDGEGVANPAAAVARSLGAEDADALRAVSLDRLFGAYDRSGGFLDLPLIIADGVALPAAPIREAFSTPGGFNAAPVMTGVNRDEIKLFQAIDPTYVRSLFGVLIWPRDRDFYNASAEYQSRMWRLRSVDEPARAMAAAGHDAVFAYRFDWDGGGRFLTTDLSTLLGAAHGLEIPFVFHRFVFAGALDRLLFRKQDAPARSALAERMGTYWAAFARDGAPGAAGGAPWGPYQPVGQIMLFDTEDDGGVRLTASPETLDAILDDLAADPRLDAAKRCRILAAFEGWWSSDDPRLQAARDACPAD